MKDGAESLLGNAGAGIADTELDEHLSAEIDHAVRGDTDLAAVGHGLDGVLDQIDQDLPDGLRICARIEGCLAGVGGDLQRGVGESGFGEKTDDIPCHAIDVGIARCACRRPVAERPQNASDALDFLVKDGNFPSGGLLL